MGCQRRRADSNRRMEVLQTLCLTTWLRRRCERGAATAVAPQSAALKPRLDQPNCRAGNRTRTGDPHLGKVVLYQLSYSRAWTKKPWATP